MHVTELLLKKRLSSSLEAICDLWYDSCRYLLFYRIVIIADGGIL